MGIQIKKIRKINSLIFAFCIIYLIQNFTIGQIDIDFNKILIGKIFLKELTFVFTSFFILKFVFD